jgi:TRAP-type mannitol/chloroaromatic compound transport system permease large subunit
VTEPDEPQSQGPFRDDARPEEAPPPLSIAAAISLPAVVVGWICALAIGQAEVMLYPAGLLLLVGFIAGLLGLSDTKPEYDATLERAVSRYQGRTLAKTALIVLLAPIVLACVGLGLLFLSCMGH